MRAYVGKLTLENKVIITDPCYNKDVFRGQMTTECRPGVYWAYVNFGADDRVTSIIIKHHNSHKAQFNRIGFIGVDAGLAGFFNNKPDYSDSEWKEMCNNYWCKRDENGDVKDYWCLDYGVVSSSGYGDGEYEVLANKERDYFKIKFI